MSTREYAQARAALDKSLALSQEMNDKMRAAQVQLEIGWLEFAAGEIDRAIYSMDECLGGKWLLKRSVRS